MAELDYTQWSSVRPLVGAQAMAGLSWIPEEDRLRIAAYTKYDQMYWNDPMQFALRVLDGEQPLYIPNARTVVDTTAHYLLKGLELTCTNTSTKTALDAFLKREVFYSRFNTAKVSGVARGDFVFHMTADPRKAPGTRISLVSVDPSSVFPIYDPDLPGKMIGCHIAVQWQDPDDPTKMLLRRLTYRVEQNETGEQRRISREEAIYELENGFGQGGKAKKVKTILPFGYLDSRITAIPVYWFKNRDWDGEDFGSSELRGLEFLMQTISQGSTDVSASLALEGLGVYATDGGRPVDADGAETDWEVSPGKVMEVPSGSYFRRVEGVTSITPAVDQIDYLENKINRAAGLSDVALGTVEAQVAESGIALAIKFMPTLAKIETRDQAGIDKLTQLFFDWKTWHATFEQEQLEGDIVPTIGDKLPTNSTERVNELNNMFDRKIISKQYYRDEMTKLGYVFPPDIEKQVDDDAEKAMLQARATMLATKNTEGGALNGKSGEAEGTLPAAGNRSNNKDRPNESAGTESKKTRDA
jgi:hypothetical protein